MSPRADDDKRSLMAEKRIVAGAGGKKKCGIGDQQAVCFSAEVLFKAGDIYSMCDWQILARKKTGVFCFFSKKENKF